MSLLTVSVAFAQDLHWSIWDMIPINLNPALTGDFDGQYRFNANHRNQWSSVTVPFVTYAASADAHHPFGSNVKGLGFQVNQDRAGDSQFNTFQFNTSGSYNVWSGKDSAQSIAIGGQLGLTNKSLNYDPLQFDVQYDGFQYNQNLNNQESFGRTSLLNLNLNLGATYSNVFDFRKKITTGLAVFNLVRPKQSLFNNTDVKQDVRWLLHSTGEWMIAEKLDLLPSILLMSQGTFKEYNLGSNVRYVITDFMGMYRTVWGGLFYRNKDAMFVNIGADYDNWKVGLNYDINLSTLTVASGARGSFEIAVQYIIKLYKSRRVMHRICPDYI